MKNYVKQCAFITLAMFSMLFLGCQKDDEEINIQQEQEIQISTLYKSDIENNNKIQKILAGYGVKNSTTGKSNTDVEIERYGFKINTDRAVYIQNQQYDSYTFPIQRAEDTGVLENLVFSKIGEDYEAYLYTYDLSEEDKLRLIEGESVSTKDKYTIKKLAINLDEVLQKNQCPVTFISIDSCYEIPGCDYKENDNDPDEHPRGDECGGNHVTITICTNTTIIESEGCNINAGGGLGGGRPTSDIDDVVGNQGGGGAPTAGEPTIISAPTSPLAFTLRIKLTREQNEFLEENPLIERDLIELNVRNDWSDESIAASEITIDLLRANRLNGPYDLTYFNILNPYFDVDTHDPFFAARLSAQIAIVKWQHKDDNWSDSRIYATALWQVLKEPVHLLLDVGGLIPVVGEAADLVNGAIYLLEGDQLNAGLSFAGAIPFAGWAATGTKLVGKVVILAGGAKAIQVIAKNTDAIAAIANKLRDKVTIVTLRGVTLLKDNFGNIIARGDDVGRFVGILADSVEFLNNPAAANAFADEIMDINRRFSDGILLNGSPATAINSALYHENVVHQACAIFKSISRGHMFSNGNKRTAVEMFKSFANKSGIEVNLTDNELLDIATKVATGEIDDVFKIGMELIN